MGDFGVAKPHSAYFREHAPDFGSYRGEPGASEPTPKVPGFRLASEPIREPAPTTVTGEVAHEDARTTASSEVGRAWDSGQLIFHAGSFESARSGFADCGRDGESAKELRSQVNRTILEDLETKVLALRALHAKLNVKSEAER